MPVEVNLMRSYFRVRVYFGAFGLLGLLMLLGSLAQHLDGIPDPGGPLLLVPKLVQGLACFGYLWVATRYSSLLQEKSPWPKRLLWLSIAAAASSVCFRGVLLGGGEGVVALLIFLLNLAYNVSLFRFLKVDEEAVAGKDALPEL